MNKLYTLGYQNLRGVAHLIEMAAPLGQSVMIADIRYTPWSKDEQWREQSLLHSLCDLNFGKLKCDYCHIKELGNVNYKTAGGPIEIWLPEVGIARLKEHLEQQPVILLCACWNVETCHRKVVGELAVKWVGCEVEHLSASRAKVEKPTKVQPQLTMF